MQMTDGATLIIEEITEQCARWSVYIYKNIKSINKDDILSVGRQRVCEIP